MPAESPRGRKPRWAGPNKRVAGEHSSRTAESCVPIYQQQHLSSPRSLVLRLDSVDCNHRKGGTARHCIGSMTRTREPALPGPANRAALPRLGTLMRAFQLGTDTGNCKTLSFKLQAAGAGRSYPSPGERMGSMLGLVGCMCVCTILPGTALKASQVRRLLR